MGNSTKAEIELDLITLVVQGKDLHMVMEPCVKHNNDCCEHWKVRAKLAGPLNKLRITIEEPTSVGRQAFVKEIIRYLMKVKKVRQTFSAAKLVMSAKRQMPDDVAAEFTVKDEPNACDWVFAADIVYPDPVYTYDPGYYDEAEDDDDDD